MFTLLEGNKCNPTTFTRASRKWPLNGTTFESFDPENGDSLQQKCLLKDSNFII